MPILFRRAVPLILCSLLAAAATVLADAPTPTTSPTEVAPIAFMQEILPNGLRVIYAPMHNAPVVQVRVLYHVGSRDERSDRQGFAHMFEHMMFRGSVHVAPEAHMHLVDSVGGICNAFTSFDKTVYHDTLPSNALEMALYLEADRMSSFKVTDKIYQIERKVVAEEWRQRQNQPYGTLFEDYLKTAFTTHSYRWTPIGNMQNLLAAPVSELQDFYNTYYVPNNAVLVIAGEFDATAAHAMVQKYFGWIPRGADVPRLATPEPPQTQPRSATVPDRVPLPAVVIGWHIPPYRSDDQYALAVLSNILGEGDSSRLSKLLVDNANPQCVDASTILEPLEDGGVFGVTGTVMAGKSTDAVEKVLRDAVADIVAHGVTESELEKAKIQTRVGLIRSRETAADIAGDIGEEALVGGDPARVNQDVPKTDAVTAADVQAIAAKYLQPSGATTLLVKPDPLGIGARRATTAAAAMLQKNAPVAASTQPVAAKDVHFPDGYPQHPPVPTAPPQAHFAKGESTTVNGVQVIVMPDTRLPLVSWNLTLRRGSNSNPPGEEGLATVTAGMLRRGAGQQSFEQLNEELESHGIDLAVSDAGDTTNITGSATTDQLQLGVDRTRDVLRAPTFPVDQFDSLKEQTVNDLAVSQESPTSVASDDTLRMLFANTPLGRPATPASVTKISLDDVKQFYRQIYRPNDAVLVISGDVTVDRGRALARQLLDGWEPEPLPAVDYTLPPMPPKRPVLLVDRPGGRGVSIRIATRAYDIHNTDKFAGSLAQTILSSGIESRLMRYVRAEKGYVYGVRGAFQPGRHAGSFLVSTETRPDVTGDCIDAIFKVLNDIRDTNVSATELAEAQRRVSGSMVMSMQTIDQQATLRTEGILNGYPPDYYDVYPQHVLAVTADQIREVMNQYVDPDQMAILVVAPAAEVKDQLQKFGLVTVMPMPAKRAGNGATTQSGLPEMMH